MKLLFDHCFIESVVVHGNKTDVFIRKYGSETIGAAWNGKMTFMSVEHGKIFGSSAPKAVINLLREFRRGLRLKGGLA